MVDNVFDALDAEPNALTVAPPAQEENPFSAFDQDPVPPSPANETVTPKTSPMPAPPLEQELLDGISISTARESAKARTEAEVKAPRMETPEEASFWGAAEHALGNQNLEAIAETLDHISDANGDPKLREWADGIRKSVKEDGSSYKAVYESYRNVRGLGDAWGYVKERAGQMVGVMAPSIIGSIAVGAGGAYVGGKAGGRLGAIAGGTMGSMAGSAAGSVHLHIADMRQALKREGVQGEDLVSYTNTGAAILGSLDMLFPALQGAKIGGFARKALADKVADKLVQNLANGGKMRTAAEFVKLYGKDLAADVLRYEVPTELAQQAVTDFGAKMAAGKQISSGDVEKFATETAPEVVLSTIIGAGFMGTPGSAIQAGRTITEVKAGGSSSAQPAAPAPAAPAGPTATPSNAAAKGDLENAPPPAPVDGTPAAAAAAEPGQADPAEEAPAPDTGTKTKSVVEFIRENGGLQPSGELDAVDAQRYPGIVSEGGLTAEEMRERLVDAGYLRETPSDQPNVTTPSDVYDLVRRATSGDRIVPVEEKAADDLYFENEGAQDPQKELAHAEKMFVAPALERYDEELGDPIYSQTFKKLEPSQRIEAIDRARRGEDIADVLEDLAFQDVLFGKATDTETLQLMTAKRGPNPELIDRIRSTLAQRQPELLRGFDDLVASLPVRRDTSGRAPLAEASHPVVTGLGKRLQAVSHDDKLFELSMAEVERDSQIDANDMRIVAADYLGYVPKVTSKEALVNLIRSSQRRARATGAATARGTGAKPAVPVSKSLTPGAVVSLYDGSRHSDIAKHLAEKGVTLDQYQKEFRLPDDYPTLAANEIARRFADASQEAKDAGIDAFERQFTIAGIRAAEEAARAEQQAAQPEAAPAKAEKPEPKPDLGLAFAQLIAGKTPRDQWAKTLGVSEAELKPHIERAVASGLLRKDKRGVVRRAAETIQAMGEPDALADSYAARLEAALGKPEFDTVYAEMAADRQMTRERVSRVASLFVSPTARGAKKSDSLQRIRSRHDNLVDARAKDAVLTAMARGVAGLIAPGEMAGQPMVATSPAILKAKQLQAAVDQAVAKILPRAVRVDVVDNIKIGKLAREDELLALRSSSSDIMPDTDTDGDGDGLSDAGGAAGKTGAQKNQKRRGSRKIADPGIGSAGIGTSAAERRILRQESATLRADGSIIVGRRSSEGRSAAARTRDDAPIQAIGTTEPFEAPGFVGLVSADRVVDHAVLAARRAPASEYKLARLIYRIYPDGTPLPDDMGAGFKPSYRKDGELHAPIMWVKVSQHLDGSWEVSYAQRLDYDQGGKGLSQKLYAAIEKDLGIHMSPSGFLTDQGLKMWQKRSPKSVQWHQYLKSEDHYVSPRRIKDRLDEIGAEIATAARLAAGNPNDKELAQDLDGFRKERGELIRLWGKLPDEARAATPNMFSIRAFHGSPHDFDRFDMSAIGTGEGAQAFGHGLYFAENEEVAKVYRDTLADIMVNGSVADVRSWEYAWAKAKLDGTLGEAMREHRSQLQALLSRPANDPGRRRDIDELARQLEIMERVERADVDRRGTIYEVEIDVEPEQLLDWDKPLNEQSESIKAALRPIVDEISNRASRDPVERRFIKLAQSGEITGKQIIREAAPLASQASARLRELGIPGIRYLDQGSRDSGEGTRNIVIFDDSLIKITHKNGKPVSAKERRGVVDQMFGLRGFYSPAIRAAETISMKKGTGEQFWKQITKAPGVRKDELEWMGLEEFLKGKASVTRDEVLAFMRAHQVELDEKVLTREPTEAEVELDDTTVIEWAREESGATNDAELVQWMDGYLREAEAGRIPDLDDGEIGAVREARDLVSLGQAGVATKFSGHKVPGGENYRELLIRLPKLEGKYTSKHFQDQEIVHLRVDDRTGPNGEKVLFINEVQSDLHQAGRRSGYDLNQEQKAALVAERRAERDRLQQEFNKLDLAKSLTDEQRQRRRTIPDEIRDLDSKIADAEAGGAPNAPFKGDLWLELALKRALLYAAENGYDAVSWARSDQIAKAVGADPEKLALQYDQKIGKFLDKYTKKWGGKVEAPAPIVAGEGGARGNPLLRITPQMRESVLEGQPFTLREDAGALQALGKTDPYALQILISMQGVEAEAARTGKSATDVATSTARHEALEFFKASDLIQPQEWDALVAAARAESWIEETGVRVPYEKLYADLPEADREEIILKEAIMEKYANFDAGKYQPKGAIAKVFQRIKDFIARLRGLVKEQGFSTWQEIFEAVDQGKLRERYEQLFGVETEGDARSAGNGAKSVAEQGAAGDAQPMIRAGQLPDARTFSNAANLNPAGVQPLRGVTEIINDLKRAMGMPVRTGRPDPELKRQAKQAGGDLFGQYNGVARTKIAGDIDTIAHEGGHHMERLLGAKLQAEMQRFDFELLPLATPGAPLSEGFAEFFRRYVTNPMMAEVRAPGFYQAFENLLDAERPQMLEQLQRVQNDYTALMLGDPVEQGIANQTVLRRAAGSFGRLLADVELDGMVSTIGDRLHQLYASMVSSHHGWWMATRDLLVEAERRTGVRATLKAIDNPYKMIRLAGHTASWATQDLKRGIAMRARPNGGGVSMHQVLATAFGGTQPDQWNERSTQEFGEYLIARRAIREYVRYNPAFRTQIQQFVAANPSLGFLLHRLPQNTTPELDRPPVKEPLFHQLNKLKLLEQRSPQFRQAAELYYEFNRDIIRFLYEKQLITREERDEYLKEKDYAPFQRDMSDREMAEGETKASRRSGRSRDQMNKRPVFNRIQGSTRDIINPVQSTVQMVYEMRLRAAVNDTLRALDRLATQAGPGGKEIFERLPPNEARAMEVKVREALKDAARQANMSPTDTQIMLTNVENQIGKNAVYKLFTMQQASEKGEKIVWFFENGKPVPAQLADGTLGHMMFQSLTAMGERGGDTITKVLAAPANLVRAGVTLSPAFILRNLWVDGLMAPLNSPHIHVPFGNIWRGIPDVAVAGRGQQMYNRYAGMMGGELYANISDQSIERDIKALRDKRFEIRLPRNLREFMNLLVRPDKIVRGATVLGEISETAGRVGIFKAAKDSAIADGMSLFDAMIEAAHYALDIMDFSRHGSKTEFVRRTVPFFNAAIQGSDKYFRTLFARNDYGGLLSMWAQYRSGQPLSLGEKRALGHAAKAWFITTAVFGGMSLLISALNDGDEDIEDIPDNIRATHWIVSLKNVYYLLPKKWSTFIDDQDGEIDTRLRLPKGFETAWFANAVERAWDYFKKNDPEAWSRYLSDIWATMAPPDSAPGLDLLYGFWTGKDLNTGRDIIPNWEKELERSEQFGPYTTQTAREIGKQINMSPYYVDYLVRGLGASLGRDVTTGIDQMIGKGPAPSIEDFPIAQRFTHNPARSSRSLTTFYDKLHGKEGVVAWFWDTVESDAKSFGSAGATYKRFVDSGQQALADDFYARLNPDQKAFATLAVDFRGRKAKLRNLHPILNAQEAVSVTNAMVKEVIEGQVKIGKDEERKSLSRDQMRMVREELRHIQRGMAQNALKILSVDGWSSQPMADVDKRMNVLKAISPEVFSEYQRRLESKDVQSFSHLAKVWPKVREELLAQRGEAEIGEYSDGKIYAD